MTKVRIIEKDPFEDLWKESLGEELPKLNIRSDASVNKSIAQKEAQNRPEVREKRCQSAKIAQNRPEVCAKRNYTLKITMNSSETLAKLKHKRQIAHNRPGARERRSQAATIAQQRPDVNEKKSRATKITMAHPCALNGEVFSSVMQLRLAHGQSKVNGARSPNIYHLTPEEAQRWFDAGMPREFKL